MSTPSGAVAAYAAKKAAEKHLEKRMKEIMKEAKRTVKKEYLTRCLAVCCFALHDEYGFSSTRLERFLKRVDNTCSYLDDETISLQDVLETLEKETGVKLYGEK